MKAGTAIRRLAWALPVAALVAAFVLLAARRADRHLREDLLRQVQLAAASFSPDQLAALRGAGDDLAAPAYRHFREALARIRQARPDCRFVYLMAQKPGGPVIFLADSEPESSEDYSPPGQVYEEATGRLLAVFAGGPATTEGPETDRWGTWVSALVPLPVTDAAGRRILLGLDVDARNWKWIVAARAAVPAVLSAIAILLGLLALLLQNSRRDLRRREAALREHRRQLKDIIDFLPDATLAVDRDRRVIIWNRAIEKMTGIPAADILGRDAQACAVPFYGEPRPMLLDLILEHREALAARYPRLLRDGDTLMAESFCRALFGGKGAWITARAAPLCDAAGETVGAIECIRDTTRLKQAEEALRASEQKLATLFDSMDEVAVLHEWILDADGRAVDYRITDCNAAFTRILGIPKAEAVGQPASEVYRSVPPPYLAEYARLRADGTPLRFESCYAPMQKHFLISAFPLGREAFATIATDVTGLRRSEEQARRLLEESNRARTALLGILEDHNRAEADLKRLATAIAQSAESIVVTDPQGLIQYVNPAFEAITGYSREEAIGQTPRLLHSGRQDAAFYRDLWATISGGRTWRGHLVNRRKDGSLYTEEAVISPVTDAGGRIVNYVGVKRDVSEHLRVTEQLHQIQRMDSIGRLAGGIAHDFNNMLTLILGHAGLALEQAGPAPALQAHLEEIRRAADRSADLTRQLLAFARQQSAAPRVLDLNATVDGTLQMLRRLIGENIELDWRPAPDLWPVRTDPSQIDQILVNLCVNARDAIRGTGRITIETANFQLDSARAALPPDAAPGDYVRLSVRDTGAGMDAETLAHIFEPFFTTKETGAGTGLGLSTVYGIVRQNGGFIEVQSQPGAGAAFHLHFPRHRPEAGAPEADAPADAVRGGRETILLVEDDYGILQIASQMLQNLGYRVLPANGPEAALRLAADPAQPIDLLLTDVVMPGMNGRDLARRILDRRPAAKVLFISGYTADIIARNGILEDGLQFIPKPFTRPALAAKIREVLDA